MAEKQDPKSDSGQNPSSLGMKKPAPGGASESDPSESGAASPRGLRKRRSVDPSGSAIQRPPSKGMKPGLSPSGKLQPSKPKRSWFRWLGFVLLDVAFAAGAYWYFVLAPSQETAAQTAAAVLPAVSKPPEVPLLFLPPAQKDHSLPRAYQADQLGALEGAVRKAAPLKPPPAVDRWCDGYRTVQDPLVSAIGYQFHDGKVCQLSVRYKAERPYDDHKAVEQAARLYGPAAGQYQYRTAAAHTVTFWEDARSLVKLDAGSEGGDRRLAALILMDKAGTLERAVKTR